MDPTAFESSLDSVTETREVWRLAVGFARGCGVRGFGYHHLPPPGAPDAHLLRVEIDGFSEALLAKYLAGRVAGVAVLARRVQQSVGPVYLDEIEGDPELSDRERAHIGGYRTAGIANGLGLQVFGPHGRNAIYAIELPAVPRRLPAPTFAALRWACQTMHLRYCVLLMPTLGILPSLSNREAEVLTWVARGKSNASIGDILGISAHTVDAHLRRIYLKLGVFDRISAALRGLGFGLIRLDV